MIHIGVPRSQRHEYALVMLAGYIQHDHGTPKAIILVTLQARNSLLDMVGTARSSHPAGNELLKGKVLVQVVSKRLKHLIFSVGSEVPSKEDILKCSKDSLLRQFLWNLPRSRHNLTRQHSSRNAILNGSNTIILLVHKINFI